MMRWVCGGRSRGCGKMGDMSDMNQVAPGWYPDAQGMMRWWDGTQWTAHTQGAVSQQYVAGSIVRPRIADDAPVNNAWVWVVALVSFATLPFIFLLDVESYIAASLTGDVAGMMSFVGGTMLLSVVSYVTAGVGILAAYQDWKRLKSLGVVRPFHWAFAFLALVVGLIVYLIGRHVVLRKVTRPSGAPLWVHIALIVASLVFSILWIVAVMQGVMADIGNFALRA